MHRRLRFQTLAVVRPHHVLTTMSLDTDICQCTHKVSRLYGAIGDDFTIGQYVSNFVGINRGLGRLVPTVGGLCLEVYCGPIMVFKKHWVC